MLRVQVQVFIDTLAAQRPNNLKKRTSHNAVESVLRLEGSLWRERFVKKVGLELAVKERGSYGW